MRRIQPMFAVTAILCMLAAPSTSSETKPNALIIVPGHADSQLIYYTRCAKVLQSNGFDVTLLVLASIEASRKFKPPPGIEGVIIDVDPERRYVFDKEDKDENPSEWYFLNSPEFPFDIYAMTAGLFPYYTESVLKQQNVLNELKAQKFDIGYAFAYSFVATGLFHVLGIEKTVLLASGNYLYHFYYPFGASLPWSYIPCHGSQFPDKMTFVQRYKNVICHVGHYYYINFHMVRGEQAAFREVYGENFPSLYELASNHQLVFLNSEELIDFPRPTLHKIIYTSGIGMSNPALLQKSWIDLINRGKKGTVLFSLGTNIKSSTMPKFIKDSLLEAFGRLKDYNFIVKFSKAELEASSIGENIHAYDWFPQRDILEMDQVKLMFTHGGFNTLMECLKSGKPLVVMPLFGDQVANAHQVHASGIGVVIDKTTITTEIVYNAVKEVLENQSYQKQALKLSKMIARKPVSAEDLFVNWSKMLIEFGKIDNFRPASADMTAVQYFLLDIVAATVLSIFFPLLILRKLIFCLCCRKRRHEKRE